MCDPTLGLATFAKNGGNIVTPITNGLSPSAPKAPKPPAPPAPPPPPSPTETRQRLPQGSARRRRERGAAGLGAFRIPLRRVN